MIEDKQQSSNGSSLLSFTDKEDVVNQEDLFSFRTQEGISTGERKQKFYHNRLGSL